jgi:hypothetical protein
MRPLQKSGIEDSGFNIIGRRFYGEIFVAAARRRLLVFPTAVSAISRGPERPRRHTRIATGKSALPAPAKWERL